MLSSICKANSLVGVSINALIPNLFWFGKSIKCCIIGIEKAAVLPVPVCAVPNKSLCSNAGGIACCCIGVGVSYP